MNFRLESLDRESLRSILKEDFDPIPDAHRLNVWKAILRLPCNKSEYLHLRDKGKKLHVDLGSLSHRRDEVSRKRISRVVRSLLAHCPTLGQFITFDLVRFVDAFAPLLSDNELVYFEVILTLLVNYCQHWFDHIPSPSYSLLSMQDIILLKSEPELYRHLASRGVRAIDYAWRWMSTAFVMIVDPNEYFNMWDHILINHPSFVYFLPLAACRLQKRFLLNLETHQQLIDCLQSDSHLDSKSLLQGAYHLYESTPDELHPRRTTHTFHPLVGGAYPMLNPTDLITFGADNSGLSNLGVLLKKVEETGAEVEMVIEEGLTLRRKLIDDE